MSAENAQSIASRSRYTRVLITTKLLNFRCQFFRIYIAQDNQDYRKVLAPPERLLKKRLGLLTCSH